MDKKETPVIQLERLAIARKVKQENYVKTMTKDAEFLNGEKNTIFLARTLLFLLGKSDNEY